MRVTEYGKKKANEVARIARNRYQDSFYKKLKDKEFFADEEFVYYGTHGYENVISIKVCRNFWDEEGKRIGAIDFILKACGVVPQFIGIGDEVVFAVASDDYELEYVFEYKQEYRNSRLRDKIDYIFDKEYDKNLILASILVEKFIRIAAPESSPIVRCYNKDYLLGHFVIECVTAFYTIIDTIAELKDLIPKGEKDIDHFLDLVENLKEPSWNNGKELYSFMDFEEDASELSENLPF